MLFRTISTYFTLVFGVLTKYRHALRADKIGKEKGVTEGYAYASAEGGKVMAKTLKRAGTELTVIGSENIPKEGNFVLVANHLSQTDPFVIMATIGRPLAFIAKIELEGVPILGKWMRLAGCVFMDRSDLKKSVKALMEGIDKVKAGMSMCIFPEGTCSDGPMLEFKGGSFKLATKSGAPILPLTIDGTRKILEDNNYLINKASVRLTYHPIIETRGLSREEEKGLAARVREIIGSALREEDRFGKDKDTCS